MLTGTGKVGQWLLPLLSSTCLQIKWVTVKISHGLEEGSHQEQAGMREGGREGSGPAPCLGEAKAGPII